MKKIKYLIPILIFLTSCSNNDDVTSSHSTTNDNISIDTILVGQTGNTGCSNPIVTEGKYYVDGNQNFLWGGNDPRTHFNISGWILDPCKLHYGLGREHFKVPKVPKFVPLQTVYNSYDDIDKVVLLDGEEEKIYPYAEIVNSEMVNDQDGNNPIMVVYCFLADLAVIYNRKFNGRVLEFGVSGYTYSDPEILNGLESFILWDRETESLWWPIIDMGVSGDFKEEEMIKYDETLWRIARWSEVKDEFPDALVFSFSGSSSDNDNK